MRSFSFLQYQDIRFSFHAHHFSLHTNNIHARLTRKAITRFIPRPTPDYRDANIRRLLLLCQNLVLSWYAQGMIQPAAASAKLAHIIRDTTNFCLCDDDCADCHSLMMMRDATPLTAMGKPNISKTAMRQMAPPPSSFRLQYLAGHGSRRTALLRAASRQHEWLNLHSLRACCHDTLVRCISTIQNRFSCVFDVHDYAIFDLIRSLTKIAAWARFPGNSHHTWSRFHERRQPS